MPIPDFQDAYQTQRALEAAMLPAKVKTLGETVRGEITDQGLHMRFAEDIYPQGASGR